MAVEFEWISLLLNEHIRLLREFTWAIRRILEMIVSGAAEGITTTMITAMDTAVINDHLRPTAVAVTVPDITIDLDHDPIHLVDINKLIFNLF